jgi:futalosine hydrolase
MRVLVVAATHGELASLDAGMRTSPHSVDRLITGIGMVATASAVARALALNPYDLALNLGVCGAFDRSMPLATVVHVVTDQLSELGVEDGAVFVAAHDMGLVDHSTGGRVINTDPPDFAVVRGLPQVRGITVNTVHGDDASIATVRTRLQPDVESMEGAAFMYACAAAGVRYAQIRAVSNHVERRNRDSWRLPEAIAALGATATALLNDL